VSKNTSVFLILEKRSEKRPQAVALLYLVSVPTSSTYDNGWPKIAKTPVAVS